MHDRHPPAQVIAEETYRKDNALRSIISPTGDNEEYTHRIGLLKKFCMNILFLKVQRSAARRNWEEALFAAAAGVAMAFARHGTKTQGQPGGVVNPPPYEWFPIRTVGGSVFSVSYAGF